MAEAAADVDDPERAVSSGPGGGQQRYEEFGEALRQAELLAEALEFRVHPDEGPVHGQGVQIAAGGGHPGDDPGGPAIAGRAEAGEDLGLADREAFAGGRIPGADQVGDLEDSG